MEGKKIVKEIELGENYRLIKLDDGEIAFLQVITPDGLGDDLKEFLEEDDKSETKSEKKSEKKSKKEPEKEEEPEGYVYEDLVKMDFDELSELCEENDLETDPADYDEDSELDEFRKAIAKELELEIPKAGKKEKKEEKEEPKEEETKADDTYTWDDLEEMDYEELEELCEENDLETDPADYDEDEEEDDLRRAIAKELGIEPPKKKKK